MSRTCTGNALPAQRQRHGPAAAWHTARLVNQGTSWYRATATAPRHMPPHRPTTTPADAHRHVRVRALWAATHQTGARGKGRGPGNGPGQSDARACLWVGARCVYAYVGPRAFASGLRVARSGGAAGNRPLGPCAGPVDDLHARAPAQHAYEAWERRSTVLQGQMGWYTPPARPPHPAVHWTSGSARQILASPNPSAGSMRPGRCGSAGAVRQDTTISPTAISAHLSCPPIALLRRGLQSAHGSTGRRLRGGRATAFRSAPARLAGHDAGRFERAPTSAARSLDRCCLDLLSR